MYISNEHKVYLKKLRKEKILVFLFRFLIIFSSVILWEVLAKMEIINTFTFSSPSRVITTLMGLIKNKFLFTHIGVTLYEVLLSFILATLIGFVFSVILWAMPLVAKIFDPYLTILNSLPKVALGPLIIIWVGASTNSIIFMSLLISTFITIINIYNGFISTDKSYITLMKAFGANKFQIFRKVIIPSNYITMISALKINISMNLIGM